MTKRIADYVADCGGLMIVAELGLNHNGSGDLAVKMAEAAIDCGADAVKVQVFDPDEFAEESATYDGRSQREMFRPYMLDKYDLERVRDVCADRGKIFFGTPTDLNAAALLDYLGAPFYKVGSDDLVHVTFLRALAKRGKGIILSTGMATENELFSVYKALGYRDLAWLHCVSLYPCPVELANLERIRSFEESDFHGILGFSDHTDDAMSAALAVASGARIIEKHFTLDRSSRGPDHAFSADPERFRTMVQLARQALVMMGDGSIDPREEEREMAKQARRLVVASRDVAKGHRVGEADLAYRRASWKPGALFPYDATRVMGRLASRDVNRGELVTLADVEDAEDDE